MCAPHDATRYKPIAYFIISFLTGPAAFRMPRPRLRAPASGATCTANTFCRVSRAVVMVITAFCRGLSYSSCRQIHSSNRGGVPQQMWQARAHTVQLVCTGIPTRPLLQPPGPCPHSRSFLKGNSKQPMSLRSRKALRQQHSRQQLEPIDLHAHILPTPQLIMHHIIVPRLMRVLTQVPTQLCNAWALDPFAVMHHQGSAHLYQPGAHPNYSLLARYECTCSHAVPGHQFLFAHLYLQRAHPTCTPIAPTPPVTGSHPRGPSRTQPPGQVPQPAPQHHQTPGSRPDPLGGARRVQRHLSGPAGGAHTCSHTPAHDTCRTTATCMHVQALAAHSKPQLKHTITQNCPSSATVRGVLCSCVMVV